MTDEGHGVFGRVLAAGENRALLTELIGGLEAEAGFRLVRTSKCSILEAPAEATDGDLAFQWVPEGSIMAILGRSGEQLFDDLTGGLHDRDHKRVVTALEESDSMAENVRRELDAQQRTVGPIDEPPELAIGFAQLPTFAEIRYGEKTLVNYFLVSADTPIDFQVFPYNGGAIDFSAFSLVEYYRAETEAPLSCLLLIRTPRLSDIERDALRLVPDRESAGHVGTAIVAFTPVAAAAGRGAAGAARAGGRVVGEGALVGAGAWAVERGLDRAFGTEGPAAGLLPPDQVAEALAGLSPEASARELLELRRRLLIEAADRR